MPKRSSKSNQSNPDVVQLDLFSITPEVSSGVMLKLKKSRQKING